MFTLVDQEGRLFKPLAYTKTLVMAIAAILALTLDPALRMMFTRMDYHTFRPRWLCAAANALLVYALARALLPRAAQLQVTPPQATAPPAGQPAWRARCTAGRRNTAIALHGWSIASSRGFSADRKLAARAARGWRDGAGTTVR